MRIFHWSSVIIVYVGLLSTPVYAAVGQFQNIQGVVKAAIGEKFSEVRDGTPLENKMTVTTGPNSHAVLKFDDNEIIVLQSNSTFKIRDYRYDTQKAQNSNMFFEMLRGGLRAITGLIGAHRHEAFHLSTPIATIGIRGTDFMAVIQQGMGKLYSHVDTGAISMTNSAGTAVFNAGQNSLVASATSLPVSISAGAIPAGTFTELGAIPVPVSTAATTATTTPPASTSATTGTASPAASPSPAAASQGSSVFQNTVTPKPAMMAGSGAPTTSSIAGGSAGGGTANAAGGVVTTAGGTAGATTGTVTAAGGTVSAAGGTTAAASAAGAAGAVGAATGSLSLVTVGYVAAGVGVAAVASNALGTSGTK